MTPRKNRLRRMLSILIVLAGFPLAAGFPVRGEADMPGGAGEIPIDAIGSCTATVPTSGRVNTPVQFETSASNAGEAYALSNVLGTLRYVPATGPGGFIQGSPTSEDGRQSDETQFTHVLTRSLAVMETEVTRAAWSLLKALAPSLPNDPSNVSISPSLLHPANKVEWGHAVLFANLVSLSAGWTRCYYTDASKTTPISSTNYLAGNYYCDFNASGYRLPTEAEWEYIARAGTTTPFSINEPKYDWTTYTACTAGTLPVLESAAVYCANSGGTAAAVGSRTGNPWNLRDVHGNLHEWCWDWYGPYPSGPQVDYAGPATGSVRACRSSCYSGIPTALRSAGREGLGPTGGWSYVGFRLVRPITAYPVLYAWTFGDGYTSAEQNPLHTYSATGTYTWTLTVTGLGAPCSTTGTINITSGPYISSITSKRGTPGSKATIKGAGFSANKSDNVVNFGRKKATVNRASATNLQVTIPNGLKKGNVNVYVKVKGVKSNAVPFEVK